MKWSIWHQSINYALSSSRCATTRLYANALLTTTALSKPPTTQPPASSAKPVTIYSSVCSATRCIQMKITPIMSYRYHHGDLEVDDSEDFWADHDENCHGEIDTPEMREEVPDGFRWSCCSKLGGTGGCTKGKHQADPARSQRGGDVPAGSNLRKNHGSHAAPAEKEEEDDDDDDDDNSSGDEDDDEDDDE
ncbi:hypothetical protein QX201_000915 [Fusarium graminearum]